MDATIEQKLNHTNSLVIGSISQLISHLSQGFNQTLDNFYKSQLQKQGYRILTHEEAISLDREKSLLEEKAIMFEEKATHDALTGLPNMGYFKQKLFDEIGLFNRYGSTFSLVLMDLKKFSNINNTYGHSTGDAALIQFANVLRTYTREVDFPARTGGDEFALILPETNIVKAGNLINRLNEIIDTTDFSYDGHKLDVHANMGVVEMKQGYTPKTLYDMADAASYASKNHSGKVYYLDDFKSKPEPVSLLLEKAA